MSNQDDSEQNINKKKIELVVARIQATISPNLKLARGIDGSLDKENMIEHVKKGDAIGQRIIQSHLNFMRAQSSGQLLAKLNTVQ